MGKLLLALAVFVLLAPIVLAGCGSTGDTGPAGTSAPTTGTVSGTATDAVKGDPLAGVTVTASSDQAGANVIATATTDDTGHYSMTVPNGGAYVNFSKQYYTKPGGMFVGIGGGLTTTLNTTMSESSAGKPSVSFAALAGDDFGYGATVALAVSANDPNDNAGSLAYSWINATEDIPQVGTVAGTGTSGSLTFPTMAQAFAPRISQDLTGFRDGADISGYILENRFGIVPIIPDTRGQVTAKVTVSDGRGQSSSVSLTLDAASILTGARNVPAGGRVYMNSGHDNANVWTLTAPSGSAAALDNASTRTPSFVADVAGTYVVTEGANSMTIYSGNWVGVIAGGAGNDIVVDPTCTGCHDGTTAIDDFTPWMQTGHAQIFTLGINGGSGTSSGSCLTCHTVGYDLGTNNGGFDDIAAAQVPPWVFPSSLKPGNWDNVPAAVKRLANIQCENCHGPNTSGAHGSTGPIGGINRYASARITFNAEVCGTCHGRTTHNIYSQWAASKHSDRALAEDEGTSTSCGRCHGAQGFLAFLDQLAAGNVGPINNLQAANPVPWSSVTAANVQPQTCTACHEPHEADNPNQLRVFDNLPVTLAGYGVAGFGKGAICVPCHSEGRSGTLDNTHTFLHEDAATGGLPPQTTSPPHVSSITDVLVGRNVYFMGGSLPMLSKHTAVKDVCVGCHMTLQPTVFYSHGEPSPKGHLFRILDSDRAALCANCHGSGTVDGEGIIAAVQAGLDALEAKMNADMLARLQGYGATQINVGTDNVEGSRFSAVAFQKNLGSSRPPGSTFKLFYDSNTKSATIALNNIALTVGGTKIFPVSGNMMKAIWNYGIIFAGAGGGKAIHNPSFELLVLSNTRAQNLGN